MKTSYVVAAAGIVVIIGATLFFALPKQDQGKVTPSAPSSEGPSAAPPPAAPAPQAAPVSADCLRPGPHPAPPDGGNATDADMKLAHDVIQAFVKQLEAYQACRIKQIDHAGADVTPQRKQIWLEQGNEAIDEAHALADAFAAQLKIYHAKHP